MPIDFRVTFSNVIHGKALWGTALKDHCVICSSSLEQEVVFFRIFFIKFVNLAPVGCCATFTLCMKSVLKGKLFYLCVEQKLCCLFSFLNELSFWGMKLFDFRRVRSDAKKKSASKKEFISLICFGHKLSLQDPFTEAEKKVTTYKDIQSRTWVILPTLSTFLLMLCI